MSAVTCFSSRGLVSGMTCFSSVADALVHSAALGLVSLVSGTTCFSSVVLWQMRNIASWAVTSVSLVSGMTCFSSVADALLHTAALGLVRFSQWHDML